MTSNVAGALRETGTFEQEARRLRELKDKLDGIAAEHKEAEAEYKDQCQTIIDLMQMQGISSTKIPGVAALSVTKKRVAIAEDWGQIFEYIHENGMAHILQKRLSSTAVDELEASGESVPGIGYQETVTLGVRKA